MNPHAFRYVQPHTEQGVLVLSLSPSKIQDEDLAMAARQDLLQAATESGATKVVVNLEHVHEISSVAFWPLLSLHRKMKETQGRMLLCGLQPGVAEVMQVTRMLSTSGSTNAPFVEAPDVAAAITRLNGGSE
jgi:anti-anti-sigma factor